jgi:hypothetical protein
MTVTDVTEPAVPEIRFAGRLRRVAGAHWLFGAVLGVAVVLRIVVMLGYPPAMYFNDSYDYLADAVFRAADVVRPDGYPLFIFILEPFRSAALITALQAVMGLAMGTGIYAVLRRRGLPAWGATLPALPVLFDVFELQLEHMIAADTLFTFCVTAALVVLSWQDRLTWPPVLIAAALLGYATLVRSEGEALIVILLIALIARRAGWRKTVAAFVVWAIPVGLYATWYDSQHGRFGLTSSSGTFLYSRVQSFAECSKMDPPANLRVLCDSRPPSQRPSSQEYLWSDQTPLATLTGDNNIYRFTPHIESITKAYAELAIEKQPLSYAHVVASDILQTFKWTRIQNNLEGSGSKFRFEDTPTPVPSWVSGDKDNSTAAARYGGASLGETRVVKPWSSFLQEYQKVFYLRGPLLLVIVLLGFAGVVTCVAGRGGGRGRFRDRGWGGGGLCLAPWLTAVALIVGPPLTAGFSYRYVLSVVPAACLAAGLAFAGYSKNAGGLTGWLREHGMLKKG